MALKARKPKAEKPISELSERQLRSLVRKGDQELDERVSRPDPGRNRSPSDAEAARAQELAEVEQLSTRVLFARDELARREQQRVKQGVDAPLRRAQMHAQAGPLRNAVIWAATNLGGTELEVDAARLSSEEGEELQQLVKNWESLSAQDRARVEGIVEVAAGDPGHFARKREQAKLKAGLVEARKRLRDPRGAMAVAAILSDEGLFDGLRDKQRTEPAGYDEYGRWHAQRLEKGVVYTLDHVAALLVITHALAENDEPVVVSEHGLVSGEHVEPGLPFLPRGAVGQLIRNEWIAPVGAGRRVTYGPRAREVCARWGIELPEQTNEDEAATA